MKKLIFLFLCCPLFIYSQTTLYLSGSSHRSQLQDAWFSGDLSGDFYYNESTLVRRTSTISFEIEQIIGKGLGGYGFTLKLNYQFVDDRRIGSDQYGNNFDFTELRQVFVPCLSFTYYLININGFAISADVGGHLQLEKFYLSLNDTDLELNNSLSPYIGAEANIKLLEGWLTLRPFIQYQMQSIYFSEVSDITGAAIDEALNGQLTGWVSGASLSLYLTL